MYCSLQVYDGGEEVVQNMSCCWRSGVTTSAVAKYNPGSLRLSKTRFIDNIFLTVQP